jgi:hypothetical protein
MRYDGRAVYGAPMAKLLGTYEMELHSALATMLGCGFDRLINIGGAEGYYAVGLARNWGMKEVVVFELDPCGRNIISQLARENSVGETVSILGRCSEPDLVGILSDECADLLIMDVEGGEMELLSRRVTSRARKSTLLVETHDFISPGCTEQLRERLNGSHDVLVVSSRERTVADFPWQSRIPATAKLHLMNEGRPGPMSWIIATPREVTCR